MSYEILDHTADVKFKAKGDSLNEVFSESVKAFADIVGGGGGATGHTVKVESENLDALLFDFLDELIFLQETENVAVGGPKEVEIEELENGYGIEATVWTDPITSQQGLLDIKAPTYSEMKVDYIKGEGWEIVAVLDI
ncbi:archease [Candidatus Nanohalococcus occultus]|uniref:archease n=1 Tax=Candidatus Nanohalococcus occultus TaxID=2978047 RepID=UPI0039E1F0DD